MAIGPRERSSIERRGGGGRGEGKKKSFTGLKWKFDRVPVEILFVRGFYFERAVIFVWIEANLMVGELFSFFFFLSFPLPLLFLSSFARIIMIVTEATLRTRRGNDGKLERNFRGCRALAFGYFFNEQLPGKKYHISVKAAVRTVPYSFAPLGVLSRYLDSANRSIVLVSSLSSIVVEGCPEGEVRKTGGKIYILDCDGMFGNDLGAT